MVDFKKDKDKLLEEVGLNSHYSFYYKRIDKGLNGTQKQADIYDRVGYTESEASLKDPVVSTCFYLSILPILQKDIVFKPIVEGKKSEIKKSKEIADFLNHSIKKIKKGGQKQLLFDIMLMKHLGTCFIEKVYEVLLSGKYSNYYYYPRFKAKRNGLWDFVYDNVDNVIGYKSLIEPDFVWNLNKFISGSWLPTFNNPNGNGDFEKIWKYYDAKKEYIIFMLEKGARIAKDNQKILIGSQGSTPSTAEHRTILAQLTKNLSCYIPAGYDLKVFDSDPKGLQIFIEVIRELDSQIARAYLGSSTLVNESTTGAGNYNTAQNNKDNAGLFQDYAEGLIKDIIEEQYMMDLILLNFDSSSYPEEVYPTVDLVHNKEFDAVYESTKDKALKDLGIIDMDTEIDLNYFREKYNLPENEELFVDLEIKKEEANNQDTTDNQDNNASSSASDSKLYE